MKYGTITLIAAVFLVSAGDFAQAADAASTGLLPKTRFEMAGEISYIKYREPGVMQERGVMYGISGAGIFHGNNMMAKIDGRFSYGMVDYSSTSTGGLKDIVDYNFETRLALGYDYALSEKAIFTPYFGIGYRYLSDDSSGDTADTGAKGYLRESNYLYSPIGLDALFALSNGWSVNLIGEYDLFWYGLQRSHLGDAGTGLSTMNNDQHHGWGARGSIKIKKKSDKFDFVLEPFVRYWVIGKSEEAALTNYDFIIGKGYEPKNKSTELGLKLGFMF